MIDEIDEIPRDTIGFIALLDESYPHRCKTRGEPEEAHQRYAGIRELIDELLIVKHEIEEGDPDADS